MHIQSSDQEVLQLGVGGYSCNWGSHLCGLYETPEERDEIIFGFLGTGLFEGDREFYVPNERSAEDFFHKFDAHCPDCVGKMHDPEMLTIVSAKDLYYPDGTFSPWAMDKGLNAVYQSSQANGKRYVRSMAEMTWALQAIPGVEHLMAYEARLNYMVAGKHWVTICLYNVNKFPGSTILNVLRTHPLTISGGVVTKNPYFVHPDKWLAEHAPEFL